MSATPEPNTDPLEMLCVATGVAVGTALGGPLGPFIGAFAGLFLKHGLELASDRVYEGLGIVARGGYGALSQRIQARLKRAPHPANGNTLQTALGKAVRAAVVEVGGPNCFKAEGQSKVNLPNGIIFRDTYAGKNLWKNEPGLGEQVDDFLRALAKHVADSTIVHGKVEVQDLLQAATPKAVTVAFYEAAVTPVLAKHWGLQRDAPPFFDHLRTNLFARTAANLKTLINTDADAWRLFNEMLLAEMRAEIASLGADTLAGLESLDTNLARMETNLATIANQLAAQLIAIGESNAHIASSFDDLYAWLEKSQDKVIAILETIQKEQKEGFAEVLDGIGELKEIVQPSAPLYSGVPSSRREFVGREALQDRIVERLLKGETLALYGEAGNGKTTLAVAIANDMRIRAHFSGGVLWGSPGVPAKVESAAILGPSPNIEGVLNQWAKGLKIDVSEIVKRADRAQAVKDAISDRPFLLIIDDCWQEDTKLLCCGGPTCAHLLTTRSLHWARTLTGGKTHTQEVPKLGEDAAYGLLEVIAEEAWTVDAQALRALAAAVDFNPLALQMMGSFLATPDITLGDKSTRAGLAKLTKPLERIKLAQERLEGEAGEQKWTFTQMVELSLTGLSPAAVRAFYSLGAFAPQPARFDMIAAQAVTDASDEELAWLLDRSLLYKEKKDAEDWLSLHQSVSDVARLSPHVAVDARTRHADYYLQVVNENREDYQRIEAVYPQIQHAWEALEADDGRIYDFLDALGTFQKRRGHWAEHEVWLRRGLVLAKATQNQAGEGNTLNNLGIVYRLQRRWQEAIEHHKAALEIFRALQDRKREGNALNNLGAVYYLQERWQEAIERYKDALVIYQALEDQFGVGNTLNNLGGFYQSQERWLEAIESFETALVIFRALQDRKGEGNALSNLGIVYQSQGRWLEAIERYKDALVIFRGLGDRHGEGHTLVNLGIVYQSQREWQEAIEPYKDALVILHALGDRLDEGRTLYNLGQVYRSQWMWEEAIKHYEAALVTFHVLGDRQGEEQTLTSLGSVYDSQGRWKEAIEQYEAALVIMRELGDPHSEGLTLANLGVLFAKQGEKVKAQATLAEALAKLHPDSPEYQDLRRRLGIEDAASDAEAGGKQTTSPVNFD